MGIAYVYDTYDNMRQYATYVTHPRTAQTPQKLKTSLNKHRPTSISSSHRRSTRTPSFSSQHRTPVQTGLDRWRSYDSRRSRSRSLGVAVAVAVVVDTQGGS